MKISTTIFRQTTLVVFLFFAFSLSVFGAEETYSYTFGSKQFAENGNKTLGGINWMLSGTDGSYWGYDATKGQQFGSDSYPYKSMKLSTSDIEGTITKIEINTSGASDIKASFQVSVGGVQYGENTQLTKSATTYTFEGSSSGEIKFEYTQTSSKAIYIKSISVTYSIQAVQKYKVTFDAGSGSCPTTELEEATITLPIATPSDECQLEGWEFAGWSETQITEDATEVSLVSNPYTPNQNSILYAVYSKEEESVGEGAESWKLTDITNIKSTDEVVITMMNNDSRETFAMVNDDGSNNPEAIKINVENDILCSSLEENLIWNILVDVETTYIIYPKGKTDIWLCSKEKETDVYLGTGNYNKFAIDGNQLKNTSTNRYLVVYNNKDWRCYKEKFNNQTLCLYVKTIGVGTIITTIYNSVPNCAEIEEHTVTFGDIAIKTENGKIANIPELPDACNVEYSTKVGWSAMSAFGVATEEPELIDENTIFTEDTQLYPVYSKDIEDKEETGVLVTNVSNLSVGNEIFIVAKDYDFALSTTQNNNNRGHIAIKKNANNNTVQTKTGIQILTLEVGTIDGTFAFYTGSGYLYAASKSANYLRTQEANNENGSWKIEIAENGTAIVKAQGTYSHNWLRYNATNTPPIFSCYESGQKDICIYKKSIVTTTSTEYYICGYETVESGDVYEVEDDFALNTLTIKSNYDQAAQINVTAGTELTAQKVIVEKTIDASHYYFFSLPFDCKIADIVATDASANSLNYYKDYTIFYYDQVKAADNKGAMGSKAWVEIIDKDAILKANQGYIIGYLVNEDKAKATIKFKSAQTQTISTPATTQLQIPNYTWYTKGSQPTANGWNLIGMPYYTKPANATLDGGDMYLYSTIPNQDGKTYSQVTFSEANISPFTSFFVQVASNEAPSFAIATQQSAAPMLRNKGAIRRAVVSLSDANGGVDNTTIIDNPNTTADYEIGHDLVKWIGYAAIPQIYSIQGDDILAFNSLAINNATVIPLGVYAHADGEYTFSLDAKSAGDLQGWELYDKVLDRTIRLANETFTIYLEKGKHEGRFELRLQQRVPTDCDNTMSDILAWTEAGRLNLTNLPVDAVVYLYDAVGHMLNATTTPSTSMSYHLPIRGIYNIVIYSAAGTITLKTIY